MTGATRMGPPASGPSPPPVGPVPPDSRQRARSRWPIVPTSGLMRSNGRVSHAGKTSTGSARNVPRSRARCSAAVPVGTTTRTGRRLPSRSMAASATAWAWVPTDRVTGPPPIRRTMAGSARRSAGRSRRLTVSGYRRPRRCWPGHPYSGGAVLKRCMATSTPSETSTSTASAACSRVTARSSRSRAPGRDST